MIRPLLDPLRLLTLVALFMGTSFSSVFAADAVIAKTSVPTASAGSPSTQATSPAATAVTAAPAALSASGSTQADPDPNSNPVLASIIKLGTQTYYLGSRGGLDGWLIVKGSQLQIAYAVHGSENLIVGALFGPSGENISSAQVDALFNTNPQLKSTFVAAAQSNGAQQNPAAAVAAAQNQVMATLAATPQVTVPPAAMPILASPGERLFQDLQKAASVTLGNTAAPQILMIMDPTCPHCKATWKMLREKVMANTVQLHLIPMSRNADKAEDENAAAQLLHVANPLDAWDKYVDGDKSQLAGTADASLLQAIRSNRALTDSWHIEHTPFLVYRGRDGQVKIVDGEPTKIEALLSDLHP